jgi:hypothetical protein
MIAVAAAEAALADCNKLVYSNGVMISHVTNDSAAVEFLHKAIGRTVEA